MLFCDHVPEQMDAFIQGVGADVGLVHINLMNGGWFESYTDSCGF